MSRYYQIPNKVNLPIVPCPVNNDPVYMCKSKPSVSIESEKKVPWPTKYRHPNISTSKENTPPRRIHKYDKLHLTMANSGLKQLY